MLVVALPGGCKSLCDGPDDSAAADRDRQLQWAKDVQKKSSFDLNGFQPSNGEQAYFTQQANRVK